MKNKKPIDKAKIKKEMEEIKSFMVVNALAASVSGPTPSLDRQFTELQLGYEDRAKLLGLSLKPNFKKKLI